MTVFDRDAGLGASEVAAALGLDPYRSPTDLWMSKTHQGQPSTTTLAMRLGNLLEDPVARLYAEQSGQVVQHHRRACPECRQAGTAYACDRSAVWDPEYPFLFAHLDRITRVGTGHPWQVLEIKTSGWPGEEWGPTGTDKVPLRVLVQCMVQMRLAGMDSAVVAVLLWGRELRTYSFPRDPQLEQDVLREVSEFWRMVQMGEPPVHPDHQRTADALRRLYPQDRAPLAAVVTEKEWDLVQRVVAAHKVWKSSEAAYNELKTLTQASLGDRAGYEWDGGSITWKASRREKVNWRFIAELVAADVLTKPEWDELVTANTTVEEVRTFRVTEKGSRNGD